MMSYSAKELEVVYWHSNKLWYRYDEENGYQLTDEAPERAKKSFELWKRTSNFD